MKLKYACLIAALAATTALAQSKTPLAVRCSSHDTVGEKICSAIRDRIAESPRYYLVGDSRGWTLNVITLDPWERSFLGGNATAVSASLVHDGRYAGSVLHYCGGRKANDCALSILTETDNVVQR